MCLSVTSPIGPVRSLFCLCDKLPFSQSYSLRHSHVYCRHEAHILYGLRMPVGVYVNEGTWLRFQQNDENAFPPPFSSPFLYLVFLYPLRPSFSAPDIIARTWRFVLKDVHTLDNKQLVTLGNDSVGFIFLSFCFRFDHTGKVIYGVCYHFVHTVPGSVLWINTVSHATEWLF